MTVEEAAELLFKQTNAPPGAINIMAWYEGNRPSIRVWINPDYRGPFSQAIKTFHGYDVIYEVRGHFEAQVMAGNIR